MTQFCFRQLPIIGAFVWQVSDAVLMARVRSIDGSYIQQSAITSIALSVYDKTAAFVLVTGPIALTVSSVIFNSLQPNDGVLWTIDQTGYNFRYRIAGLTAFPLAHDYRVDVIFTLTDGTTFPVQFDLSTQAVP